MQRSYCMVQRVYIYQAARTYVQPDALHWKKQHHNMPCDGMSQRVGAP